ncbi:MAG: M28 family peptidase [Candidatus Thermoplasmatota archaeon]
MNKTELNVDLKPWNKRGFSGENIEATLKGRNNNDKDVFILCAHYDSVDVSSLEQMTMDQVYQLFLSIAEILSGYVFNSTLKFVLFSGEEQALLGSKCYVEKITEKNVNIAGVLNLDGVGYASNAEEGSKICHFANSQSSWMQDISKNISDNYNECIGLKIKALPHVTSSDHQSFVRKGYDASYLFEGKLNPYYHTSEDKSENMNFTYLSKVCNLSLGCLVTMAELKPKNKEEKIDVKIKGGILTKPGQLSIEILNNNYPMDTLNTTININLEPIFFNKIFFKKYLKYNSTFNWAIKKEIKEEWFFKTKTRNFFSGLFKLSVELKGFNDDIYIYKQKETFGVVLFNSFVFLIPRNI